VTLNQALTSLAFAISINAVSAVDLPVRIYQQPDIDASVVQTAVQYAADLLRPAGVFLQPEVCGECPTETGPGTLVIRISYRIFSGNARQLGMSFAVGQAGTVATIYAPAVFEAARRESVEPSIILGHVIAHEIAHLLGLKHGRGLMRDGWRHDDYNLMRQFRLGLDHADLAILQSR